MKIYVTFGSAHYHEIDGVVYDRNCVAEIEAPDFATGRDIAFEVFGPRFCTTYTEKTLRLEFFRRGIIPLKTKRTDKLMTNEHEVYELSVYEGSDLLPDNLYILIFGPNDLRKWAKTLAKKIPHKAMYIGGMYPPMAATLLEEDDDIADRLIAFKDPDWLRFGGWEFKVYEDEITIIARPKNHEGEIFCTIPLLDGVKIKEAQELANSVDRKLL